MSPTLTRFLRYVRIDTQSSFTSTSTPTTSKQLDLSRLLLTELHEMGLTGATMSEHGYVYAYIPSNLHISDISNKTKRPIPSIGLCAHVDTSPDASGTNVSPQIHENYQGGQITLPHSNNPDSPVVLDPQHDTALQTMIGHDIVTSGGTTLLGADDKAGVAEIMTVLEYLTTHPDTPHPDIYICFTPDEEVGKGSDHIDLDVFAPDFCYTIDGSHRGEFSIGNFNADKIRVIFHGHSVHPGHAKGKLINAIKIAQTFINQLPQEHSPETTEALQGFIHPTRIEGGCETATVDLIIRSFDMGELKGFGKFVEKAAQGACDQRSATYTLEHTQQYRNMYDVVKLHPQLTDIATRAMESLGITPDITHIRGGTDGARLTALGIPTPNLFAGGHNFHSVKEYISVQDMDAAVETILEIVKTRGEVDRNAKQG